MVLWWVAAGYIPSVEEAKVKLTHLNQNGATPLAFTFAKRFTIADMLEARAKS